MKLYAVTLTDGTSREVTIEYYAENEVQAEAFGQNAFAAARGETFDPAAHRVVNVEQVLTK